LHRGVKVLMLILNPLKQTAVLYYLLNIFIVSEVKKSWESMIIETLWCSYNKGIS